MPKPKKPGVEKQLGLFLVKDAGPRKHRKKTAPADGGSAGDSAPDFSAVDTSLDPIRRDVRTTYHSPDNPGWTKFPEGAVENIADPTERAAEIKRRADEHTANLEYAEKNELPKPAEPPLPSWGNAKKAYWQMPLLATAQEIKDQYQPLTGDMKYLAHSEKPEEWLWEDKAEHADTEPAEVLKYMDLENQDLWAPDAHDIDDMIPKLRSDGSLRTPSLTESIHKTGGVLRHPVMLSDPLTGGIGQLGKPMILGGHHRIAVMARDFPHMLMPVQFEHSFDDTRHGKDENNRPNYR